MAIEKFDCGCTTTFGKSGEVRAAEVCARHDNVFSEHKSLRQIALDIQHQQLVDKHTPKVDVPPVDSEEPA